MVTVKGFTEKSIEDVLGMKELLFAKDSINGYRICRNGSMISANESTAVNIAERYVFAEEIYGKIRKLLTSPQKSGMIEYKDIFPLGKQELRNELLFLKREGLVSRFDEYSSGFYINMNPSAQEFLAKDWSVMSTVNYIRNNLKPDEMYFSSLLKDRYREDTYPVDLIYRKGKAVKFCIVAVSPNLLMPGKLERIARTANRLKSLDIVISPSLDIRNLTTELSKMLSEKTNIQIRTFDELYSVKDHRHRIRT